MTLQAQIKWVTNLADFKKAIEDGTGSVVAHTARVDKLTQSLGGTGLLGAANNYVAAVERMGGVEKLTANEKDRINTLLVKAIDKYQALGREAPDALQRLATATKPVSENTTLAQKATDFLSTSLLRLASSFAIGGLIERGVSALMSWGSAALESAGSMVDMSDKTGLSLRTIQQMEFVAKQTGTSIEAFSNAAFKLGVNLSGGSNSVVAAVNDLGLSYRNLRAQSPDEQFNAVIVALENMKDPQERNRIAVELFGKAARDILPAIAGGYTNVASAARLASDEQVRAIDRQQDAWERFKSNVGTSVIQALGGVWLGVEKLTGSVNDVPKAVKPAAESFLSYQYELERAKTALGNLTEWQKAEIEAGQKVGKGTEELAEKFNVSQTVIKLLTEETQKNTAEQKKAAAAAEAAQKVQTDAIEAVRAAMIPLTAAQQAAAISNEKLGISAETTGKQLGVSGAAIATFLDGIKGAKDIAEIWRKAHETMTDASSKMVGKAVDDWQAGQQKMADASAQGITAQLLEYQEFKEKNYQLTLSGTALTVRQIELERDKRIAALNAASTARGVIYENDLAEINRFYQTQVGIATGTADTLDIRMRQQGIVTKDVLQQQADDARRDYEQMAARSGEFSEKAVRDQKRIADRAQAAANDTMTAWDRTYSMLGDAATILNNIPGKFTEIASVAVKTGQAIMENLADGNVWGAVVAGITGAITALKKLFTGFSAGRDEVEKFAASFGGFDDLHAKLLTLGAAGEALWIKLTQGVGKNNPEQAKAVIEEINKALAGQDAWMQRLPGLIEKYGLSWEQAGKQANQARLDEIAKGLIQDFADLSKAGFDVTLITEKMSDAINDYVRQAVATGTEVPAAMRPLLQKMIEMGTLTDANGNKITDLEDSGITFATTMTEGFKSVVDAIKELTKALGGIPDALNRIPGKKVIEVEYRETGKRPDDDPTGASAGERFHSGTAKVLPFPIVAHNGLLPDEVPAILQTGEAVLNRRAVAAIGAPAVGALNRGDRPSADRAQARELRALREDLAQQRVRADNDRRFILHELPAAIEAAIRKGAA